MSTSASPTLWKTSTAAFPVDGQLLMLLPRAGASLRNPDVRSPMFRSDPDGYYLEMRVEADTTDSSEVAITRRVPLDNLTEEAWYQLQDVYAQLNLAGSGSLEKGLSQGLTQVDDRRIQRLLNGVMTFLNPRQVAILLHLYALAAQQGQQPTLTLQSNDLLEKLGYTRTKDGGFASKLRSQLHRDLVALHRTELMFSHAPRKGVANPKIKIQNILKIHDWEVGGKAKKFDIFHAADYTYELADSYTIELQFFDGISRSNDYLLFPHSFNITQRLGNTTKNDYKTRLLVYLASRMKWDNPQDGQYMIISKQYLFKNLDLLGSNSSRNNQIFWRTIEELKQEQYLLGAQELPGKRKINSIQFQINPEMLRCS
ncbi:MAG: hypothetical protein B0A82_17540 [Alkalinema sp. CACIAM 70d]|nr:MAG: hypothetical protein B0A82_17540 [Alkalinema sp. CACIAM 70d]